jgi:hypothetical protein
MDALLHGTVWMHYCTVKLSTFKLLVLCRKDNISAQVEVVFTLTESGIKAAGVLITILRRKICFIAV